MSVSDLLQGALQLGAVAVALFIVARALVLRRVLVDHPYRARALWAAVGGLTFLSFLATGPVDAFFGETPTNLTGVVVEDVIWGFTFVVLFGWIASNINVAIDADYFHQDVLLWKRGGEIAGLTALFGAWFIVSLPPWWLTQAESDIAGDVISIVFVALVVYSSAVLVVSYRRIADRRIKTYTLWVAASIASLLLLIVLPPTISILAGLWWVFCLYQSVGSLAIRTKSLPTN